MDSDGCELQKLLLIDQGLTESSTTTRKITLFDGEGGMDCQPKLQLYSMLFFEIFLKSLWLYAREDKEHTIICKLKYIPTGLTNK